MPQKRRPKESNFQNRVLTRLKTLPHSFFYKVQAGSIGGIPDVVGTVAGIAVFLELKRDEKSCPTPLQAYTVEKIAGTGAIAAIIHPGTFEEMYRVLKKISEEAVSVQDFIQRIAR